jgi:L-lactate dehydrogenase complex protein LldE
MDEIVQLLVTCIIDSLYPETGEAVVRVLNRAGVSVEFPPDQTCCGQPAFNAGMRGLSRSLAEQTIRVFEKTQGAIVVPSGSCTAMIRHGYPELFQGDPDWLRRVKTISERTYEFSEFLVDILGVSDVGASISDSYTYHASCHLLRGLGVSYQPRTLLKTIRGGKFTELPHSEECCGFGGLFSIEHPEVSGAMLDRKIANIEASGANLIVSCDAGCITNINGGLHRLGKPQRAIHIADLLAGSIPDKPNH